MKSGTSAVFTPLTDVAVKSYKRSSGTHRSTRTTTCSTRTRALHVVPGCTVCTLSSPRYSPRSMAGSRMSPQKLTFFSESHLLPTILVPPCWIGPPSRRTGQSCGRSKPRTAWISVKQAARHRKNAKLPFFLCRHPVAEIHLGDSSISGTVPVPICCIIRLLPSSFRAVSHFRAQDRYF